MLAGALLGFAFLTKMLQGLLVVPAFAIAYLVAAPTSLRKRVAAHCSAAGAAMFVAAGWWVALVELWPAGSRPYIGGSTNNSVLELIFGYNGIGRLTGSSNNGNVGGGTGGFSSGETGLTRLFGTDMGTQISWLLPAALVGIAALGWLTLAARRAPIGCAPALIVWGGWLLCTGVVLSFASGIIHPYYTVALAPGDRRARRRSPSSTLWRARADEAARWLLAALVAAGAWWTFELLGRAADWHAVAALGRRCSSGVAAAIVVLLPRMRGRGWSRRWSPATLLLAPTAYSLQTASTAHTGALPTAGPTSTAGVRRPAAAPAVASGGGPRPAAAPAGGAAVAGRRRRRRHGRRRAGRRHRRRPAAASAARGWRRRRRHARRSRRRDARSAPR